MEEFFAANNEEVVDGRIATAVQYLKEELGIEKFGVTGYCFGGRYAFRVQEASAVFAAHPSNLLDEEISGVGLPASLAVAGELFIPSVSHWSHRKPPFSHCSPTSADSTDEQAVSNISANEPYPETDELLGPERRTEIETLLGAAEPAYQMSLYGGTAHGFAVRANISDPQQKFGKESAFLQAVRWFDVWAME